MNAEVKELAKSTFEFSSVPHCIVVDKVNFYVLLVSQLLKFINLFGFLADSLEE